MIATRVHNVAHSAASGTSGERLQDRGVWAMGSCISLASLVPAG